MILWGAGPCPSEIGGGQRKLMGGEDQKAREVVWQWVPTFNEAVPPPSGDEEWEAVSKHRSLLMRDGDEYQLKEVSDNGRGGE